MSQGVIIGLLVLSGLITLRMTNLSPFSGNNLNAQSPAPNQTLPTPLTRSTGYSTGLATNASNTTTTDDLSAPGSTQTGPASTGAGSSTGTGTPRQPPVRGRW